jgi:hypothetical protein
LTWLDLKEKQKSVSETERADENSLPTVTLVETVAETPVERNLALAN